MMNYLSLDFTAVKRHQDQGNSYRRKHLIGSSLLSLQEQESGKPLVDSLLRERVSVWDNTSATANLCCQLVTPGEREPRLRNYSIRAGKHCTTELYYSPPLDISKALLFHSSTESTFLMFTEGRNSLSPTCLHSGACLILFENCSFLSP